MPPSVTTISSEQLPVQQWTNAESILEYLAFAKRYIAACEELRPQRRQALLGHALMDQGVFRYRRPPRPSRALA
jgi:spore cortex formation protein SpoVR/YcgB (stage V sporulation)